MSLINQLWQQLIPYRQANRWVVGFSGGMDSTVLLYLLHELKQKNNLPKLEAVYIHHGLQAIAESWPEHCQTICDSLDVPLTIIKVKVAQQASIEQAAREARYQAFVQMLQTNDILLTAQHQNDQVETLLFRLVRGTGLRGLTGIPKTRPLASNTDIVRPLLGIPHKKLKQYAKTHQLQWVDDPSNEDTHFARNYLRHKVVPVLEKYWPQAVNNIAQAADHLQEAQSLLQELAKQDLSIAHTESPYTWLPLPNLLLEPISQLSWVRQKNALSFWLAQYTLLPSAEHWQGWHDFIHAKESASPIWQLHNVALHRSNNRIWLLMDHWLETASPIKQSISLDQTLYLVNNGSVTLTGDLPNKPLFITYRKGGESIDLNNRGHRDLKRLLNEQAVPQFIRQRIPLLQDRQGTLIAVANFPQWRDKNHPKNFTFEWNPTDNLY